MSLFVPGTVPALDSDGNPISGATWSFYVVDTTTPQAVYSDSDLQSSLGSVITSGGDGRFIMSYLDDSRFYKAVMRNSAGSIIFEIEDVNSNDALATDLAELEAAIAAEAVARESADNALDTRIDNLEATVVSGIRVYATWDELNAAFVEYDPGTAYVIDDTVLNQGAWWVNIQNVTGTAPPTLPDTDNAYWVLITAAPSGQVAQVSFGDDGNTHTDPVFGGTVDNPGVYKWYTADEAFGRIDDLDSQVAQGFAEDAETAADTLGGSALLGDIPTKPDNVNGNIDWAARTEFSLQPVLTTDVTDSAEYQFHGTFTSPGTRYSSAVVGDELELTSLTNNIFPVGTITSTQTRNGGVYKARGRITSSSSYAATGIAISLDPTAPTLGGAVTNFDSGSCHIVVRCNGTVVPYDYVTSVNFVGATVSDSNVDTFTTEEVVITLEYISSTIANLYITIGGKAQLPRTVSGLPANCYFGASVRFGNNTTIGMLSEIEHAGVSMDLPKRLHFLGGATSGTGSPSLPYGSFTEAIADIQKDTARRTLDITLKGGTIADSLRIDATRWKEITIRGVTGQRPIVKTSTLVATTWTQILSSDVWYTARPTYYDNNSGYGTLIDVTAGRNFAYGRTGIYTVEGNGIFGRNSPNVAYDDASFGPGTCSVHNTGPYSGNILVRMHDDSDPNDGDIEFTQYDYGINITATNESSGWNSCRVNIEGIDVHGAFLTGVNFRRVKYHLEDVLSESHGFFGFELDQCSGQGFGLRAESTAGDGFHWNGISTAADKELRSQFFDCWARGQGYFPEMSFWGDGWSNHEPQEHRIALFGCGSIGAGKSGIATPGNVELHDFIAKDAWSSGIELYGDATDPATTEVNVYGGEVAYNNYGMYCHTDGLANQTRTINADRLRFDTNAVNSVIAVANDATSDSTVNMKDCLYKGATPSGGHKALVGDYSSINVETSTPAV